MLETAAQIQYVLFDAGGTLLGTNTDVEHWYEQFFIDACAEQGRVVELPQVQRILHQAVELFKHERRCSTDQQVRTFWEHVYAHAFQHLIPTANPTALAHHYIDRFESGEFIRLFDDTLSTLETLKTQNIPMGVVSNFGAYLHDFLDQTGIRHYFEFAIVSACEGCEKPEPRIFEMAIERTQLRPAQILFVGDSLTEDYAAAQNAGLIPLLIDRHNRHAKNQTLNRIKTLTQIPLLLR